MRLLTIRTPLAEYPSENRKSMERACGIGNSYKELSVWERAVKLSLAVYRCTSTFPPSEQFGLNSQLRRSSVSIASNIAEGYGKVTKGEYPQSRGHARGSIFELETQLAISEALNFGSRSDSKTALSLAQEVSKMLVSLMAKLKKLN